MPDERIQIGTKEVGILRKAGKLAEALEHGRRLYAETPDDPWAARELAWCLYDETKRLQRIDDGKNLEKTKAELREIGIPKDERDKILHECVSRILGASPAVDACFRATELSKAGKHREAVQLLRPFAMLKESMSQVGESYGWVLYRKLRDTGEDKANVAIWCLNQFFACWSSDWVPNVMLFKCMLIQAKIQVEGWDGLVPLVEKLGLHRVPAEQFADDRPDSDFESFPNQLLASIYKSLKMHPDLHGERPALQQLLIAWKDSLGGGKSGHYHLGRILLWTGGDRDQARVLLLKAVQENPDEYWRWLALADALGGPELKIVLSKAVCCVAEDESHKIPLFKKYADLLAAEGELGPASASIKEAIRLRALSGREWRDSMPPWFHRDNADGNLDILEYARPYSDRAYEILAEGLEACVCAIVRPLKSDGRFLCIKEDGQTITLKFRKSEGPASEIVAIRAKYLEKAGGASTVLSWEPCAISSNFGILQIGVVFEIKASSAKSAGEF